MVVAGIDSFEIEKKYLTGVTTNPHIGQKNDLFNEFFW
jgi:hypothetical protein